MNMRQSLQEPWSQGLFDVEIGQFESVSFNFSQLTGPPWVPLHFSHIGNKLDFLFFLPFFSPVLSAYSVFKPLFLFLYVLSGYAPQYILPVVPFPVELRFHPGVCQTLSHQHKTSLMLPLRHLLYSERGMCFSLSPLARPVFKTNKQNNGSNTSLLSVQTSYFLPR